MGIATKAINDGTELNQGLTAQYLSAGMKQNASDLRKGESADTEKATDNLDESDNADLDNATGIEISAGFTALIQCHRTRPMGRSQLSPTPAPRQ